MNQGSVLSLKSLSLAREKQDLFRYLIVATFFILYSVEATLRYFYFVNNHFDLAIFTQVINNYAHFDTPTSTLKGINYNIFGDHFHPAIALVAPFFRVFPSPVTLLVAQAFLFALSINVFMRFAIRKLGQLPGILLGLSYGLSYGLWMAIHDDFHEIAFSVPVIVLALEAYLDKKYKLAFIYAFLLTFTKEDFGITFCLFFGVLIYLSGSKKYGLLTSVLGVLMSCLAIFYVIPHFNPNHVYPYFATTVGKSSNPLHSLLTQISSQHFWLTDNSKQQAIFLLLITSLGVALLSPVTLLVLPVLIFRMLSVNITYWSWTFHYDAVLMPIIFMGLVDGLVRARKHLPIKNIYLSISTISLGLSLLIFAMIPPIQSFALPVKGLSGASLDVSKVAHFIPVGVSVESVPILDSDLVMDHLNSLFTLGNVHGLAPEYLVYSETNATTIDALGIQKYLVMIHPGHKYSEVAHFGVYHVYHKIGN